MRLTTFTDYCLRVLVYVGTKKGDELATIDEIASSYAISRGHIMKVVFRLGQLGYLETVRGKGGGMRLSRSADKINLGAVIRDTEDDFHLVSCFEPGVETCRILPSCVLRGALHKATKAFFDVLDGYTLADLLGPRQKLGKLLQIS